MARDYATDQQIQDSLSPGVEYDPADATQAARMARLVTRATGFIDGYLEPLRHPSAEQVFEVPAASKSSRVFYGNGRVLLRVGRIKDGEEIASTDVSLPSGWDKPTFARQGDYLRTCDSAGRLYEDGQGGDWSGFWGGARVWPEGLPVTVSAKWGYTTVPGDITEACVAIVTHWWRARRALYDENYPKTTERVSPALDVPSDAIDLLDRRLASGTLLVVGA